MNLETVLTLEAAIVHSIHKLSFLYITAIDMCFLSPGATGVIHDVPLKSIKDLCRVSQDIPGHARADATGEIQDGELHGLIIVDLC